MKKLTAMFLVSMFILTPFAFAAETGVEEILAPINKIYDLVKGAVSVLGIIAITIAAALYMFSGNNIQSRENAKSMVSYSIVGLVLVWMAPLIVQFLTSPVGI